MASREDRLFILPALSSFSDRRERRHFPTEEDNQRQMKDDSEGRGGGDCVTTSKDISVQNQQAAARDAHDFDEARHRWV